MSNGRPSAWKLILGELKQDLFGKTKPKKKPKKKKKPPVQSVSSGMKSKLTKTHRETGKIR